MKKGTFSKLGIMMAAAVGLGAMSAPNQSTAQQQNAPQTKRDAVTHKESNVTPETVRKQMDSYIKHTKAGAAHRFLNQRQYRKLCRQNPSLYKAKKHRSRN